MKGETDTLDSAVYTLSNPEDMDDFVDEVESEIDTDSYSVTSSDEIYEQMLSPLNITIFHQLLKTSLSW